jgi:hypothetical protein
VSLACLVQKAADLLYGVRHLSPRAGLLPAP